MYQFLILSVCLFNFTILYSHEGHKEMERKEARQESSHSTQDQPTVEQFGGRPKNWTQWIGSFHFIFLHFPIALIAMTAISELLYAWYNKPIFDYAALFMLISAAILAIPTAILGLTYSYTAIYTGVLADFVWWHMWTGILTAVFAIIVAFLRAQYGITNFYYICLIFLFLLVNITGFLGGGMTFGPYHMYAPL